ncbi:MAG: hypothetical protein M5U34_20205 [Chloroflexi bacterium]|nr:hypothetical protein [Chloroflexota bacterium]
MVNYGVKQGRLIIKQTGEIFELRALLPGRVVKIYPERGVLLETYGALIQGIWSTADEVMGKIKLLTFSPDGFIFPEQLNADLSGMILAIGHIDQAHILEKASDTGVRAIITRNHALSSVSDCQVLRYADFCD